MIDYKTQGPGTGSNPVGGEVRKNWAQYLILAVALVGMLVVGYLLGLDNGFAQGFLTAKNMCPAELIVPIG